MFFNKTAKYIRDTIYLAALEKALAENHKSFSALPPEEQSWFQNLEKAGISADDREMDEAANAHNVIFEVFVNSGRIKMSFSLALISSSQGSHNYCWMP